jgi:ribosomal protein RSM22 (predicted rRNA methylase)
MKIVAPCPHQIKCPLAKSKSWCHFDQPTGMYPKQIFGKLPTDNSIKSEKMSYLIIQNTAVAN